MNKSSLQLELPYMKVYDLTEKIDEHVEKIKELEKDLKNLENNKKDVWRMVKCGVATTLALATYYKLGGDLTFLLAGDNLDSLSKLTCAVSWAGVGSLMITVPVHYLVSAFTEDTKESIKEEKSKLESMINSENRLYQKDFYGFNGVEVMEK